MIQSVATTGSREIREAIVERYGIGMLSRKTGCNIETIRYYERIGILHEPPRTSGGHRSYSPDHAGRLSFIVRARELGFSIEEIRQLLTLIEDGVSCEQVQAITLKHLKTIYGRIDDLKRLASVLQAAAGECQGGDTPDCPIIDVLLGSGSQVRPDDNAMSGRLKSRNGG